MLDAARDLLLGSSCAACGAPGRVLCSACAAALPAAAVGVRPTPCPEGLVPCFVAGEYAGALRSLLLAHKERGALGLCRPLGTLLAVAVRPVTGPFRLALVPVPSRSAVVRERGHDPVLRMARVAAGRLRAEGRSASVVPLLRPRLAVADQAGLGAAARAANLAGSLTVRDAGLRALARAGRPTVAVVCDDVLTTGATAREAQRALQEHGVPVRAVACVAATRRRRAPDPSSLPV
jgi:predicted amidophosphoribosyltransferase